MAPPQELILSSSSSYVAPSTAAPSKRATFAPISSTPSSSSGPSYSSTIALHDLTTSSLVHTFKPSGGTSLHGLSHINSRQGKGGLLFGAQEGKALLHVWAWQKDQLHLKLHLPEKLACFEVSPNGIWAAGGTTTGHVYLWEIASGLLMASFDAAYRKINMIKFDDSSVVLVCGSEDSSITVWSVSRLVDNALANAIPQPFASFSHHTLAITSLHISHASFPHCRLYSTSLDGTLKIFSLDTPALLSSFVLPTGQVPTCVAVDPLERYVYVGTNGGEIHHIRLFRRRREMGISSEEDYGNEKIGGGGGGGSGGSGDADGGDRLEDQVIAIGGEGLGSEPIKVGQDDAPDGSRAKGKGKISLGVSITSIALSISQSHLLTGTSTGDIHLHSLPSHTLLRTIATHSGTPVTHLSTLIRPADLVGHINFASLIGSGSGTNGNKSEEWPIMECRPFERMRVGRKERDEQEIGILLGGIDGEFEEMDGLDTSVYLEEEDVVGFGGAAGYSGGIRGLGGSNQEAAARTEDKVNALEAEVAKLKSQLQRAKEINDTMWNGVIDKALRDSERNKKGGGSRVNGEMTSADVLADEEDVVMID